jgi:hypothetical protein
LLSARRPIGGGGNGAGAGGREGSERGGDLGLGRLLREPLDGQLARLSGHRRGAEPAVGAELDQRVQEHAVRFAFDGEHPDALGGH